MKRKRTLVSWSGGKDSCLMLHEIARGGEWEAAALVCMIKGKENRISMHGVPVELLERQAQALRLPVVKAIVSPDMPYEAALEKAISPFRAQGVTHIAYGDLFLADIRAYREKLHARIGLECLFPVWMRDTAAFAQDFLAAGYKAIVTCVDARKLAIDFAGRAFDAAFLRDLPASVDPCGENGEFHTFVHAGPLFREPVAFTASAPERVRYEDPGHAFELGFCDLIPAAAEPALESRA